MDSDFSLGYCIIKIICLIVIAMSVHKIAYSREYMNDGLVGSQQVSVPGSFGTANGIRFYGETQQSMFNNPEPPVFWNAGSFEDSNSALQAAASMGVDKDTYGNVSKFENRSFAEGENLNHHIGNAIIGL